MKKILVLLMVLVLTLSISVGCSNNNENETTGEETDVITTASLVKTADAFVNGLSADGTWIVATLNDITVKDNLLVDGEFLHRDEIARKLALYTQDEDRNVIDRFTLTAPRLVVRSENFKIQGGIFRGDVYVEANGFEVKDATIEGNVYFMTQEYMDSFILDDEKGKVTGVMEVK